MPSGGRPYDPYTRCDYILQCGGQRNCMQCLTMSALHDLEVKAADVLNAYMMIPNKEKIKTVLGLEFGNHAGKSAIIV